MGIDFSPDGKLGSAHWSYSGFDHFRKRLAEGIGICLEKMHGFGGNRSWDKVADPIVALLYHSDCDGELTPEECRSVAPRLRELVAPWDENDYDKVNAMALAACMDTAAEMGEPLIFC